VVAPAEGRWKKAQGSQGAEEEEENPGIPEVAGDLGSWTAGEVES